MNRKEKISPSGSITIAILLSLAGANAVWLIISGHRGALIALVFYLIVAFLCIRSRHFGAGVIAGIFGFGVHIYELFLQGTTELVGIDQAFFYANLILPVPLIFKSY